MYQKKPEHPGRKPRRKPFHKDEDGVISVEFILTFPLLIMWLLGSFIFFDVFRSYARTEKVAYAISDATSLLTSVDTAMLDDFWTVQQQMLPPRTTRRAMRISSICWRDNQYRIMWSYARHGDDTQIDPLQDTLEDQVPVPIMPILADGDSIILTEVYAEWVPLSDNIFGLQMRNHMVENRLAQRPRDVQLLQNVSVNNRDTCPTATQDVFGNILDGGDDGPVQDDNEIPPETDQPPVDDGPVTENPDDDTNRDDPSENNTPTGSTLPTITPEEI